METMIGASARRAAWLLAAIAIGFALLAAQVDRTSAQSAPSIQVSKTEVNPEGDTITVTGTGFLPSLATGTRPPFAGQPGGVYIAFGAFADVWKPSEGAPSSARPTTPMGEGGSALIWAVPEAQRDTIGRDASVALNPDGSFVATLTVERDYEGALPDGNYGVYTYAGSGAIQPLFETFTPITFTAQASPTAPASPTADPSPTTPAATPTTPAASPTAPAASPTSATVAPGAPTTGDSAGTTSGSMTSMYLLIAGAALLVGSTGLAVASAKVNRRD